MTEDNDWVLYIIPNSNLDSMNPGKMGAHAAHAANAFTFKHYSDYACTEGVFEWVNSTSQGFGTTFVLKAKFWEDVVALSDFAKDSGHPFEYIIDPTYPFEVSHEVYYLLNPIYRANATRKQNGNWTCYREEVTAAYIFGRKSDERLQKALKHFKRHP